MLSRDRFAWVLIGATALASMVAGHAVELWIENAHAFGESAAGYRHVAQSSSAEASTLLFVLVAAALLSRFIGLLVRRPSRKDCVLPALHAIAEAGFVRVALSLAALQLSALFVAELGEQRLSGFQGNAIAAIAGPGHATALGVHLLIAALVALVLCRFARFASARTSDLVEAVFTFLRHAFNARVCRSGAVRRLPDAACIFTRRLSLLSLGLANRPPPLTSAHRA